LVLQTVVVRNTRRAIPSFYVVLAAALPRGTVTRHAVTRGSSAIAFTRQAALRISRAEVIIATLANVALAASHKCFAVALPSVDSAQHTSSIVHYTRGITATGQAGSGRIKSYSLRMVEEWEAELALAPRGASGAVDALPHASGCRVDAGTGVIVALAPLTLVGRGGNTRLPWLVVEEREALVAVSASCTMLAVAG